MMPDLLMAISLIIGPAVLGLVIGIVLVVSGSIRSMVRRIRNWYRGRRSKPLLGQRMEPRL